MSENNILQQLSDVLVERKDANPKTSYVADLYHRGTDAILKKIGEEATETVLAAKGNDRNHVVKELADLWFHCLVLLAHQNISYTEVLKELAKRFGTSGIEEKNHRHSVSAVE